MNIVFALTLVTSSLLSGLIHASDVISSDEYLTLEDIKALSKTYSKPEPVLMDYFSSYNFKCPKPLLNGQMVWLLTKAPYDSDLNIMIESTEMAFRDVYVEARAGIQCLTKGQVSNAY